MGANPILLSKREVQRYYASSWYLLSPEMNSEEFRNHFQELTNEGAVRVAEATFDDVSIENPLTMLYALTQAARASRRYGRMPSGGVPARVSSGEHD